MPALSDLTWPRTTERLALRPIEEADLDAVWAYCSRPEVDRWLGSRIADREAFATRYFDPSTPPRTLVVEHEGRLVGDLMLRVEACWAQRDVAEAAKDNQAELGWVFDPAYGGRGLATEAVTALLAIALAPAPSGLGLRRVTAGCFADNTASWRLMDRVGMRREHHAIADALHRDLGWVDSYYYALLAEEWRAMSERD